MQPIFIAVRMASRINNSAIVLLTLLVELRDADQI
jgi:hypothetical protein